MLVLCSFLIYKYVAAWINVDFIPTQTYSLIAEAIYENRLKPFTFSAGTNLNWKYMDNADSDDDFMMTLLHRAH